MPNHPSVPKGLIPHLIVRGGKEAISFYERAFSAKRLFELEMPDGKLGHAELAIGDARFMLADEFPDMNCISPAGRGGTSVHLTLYVEDVDRFVERALAAGAVLERPISDEFYGDRVAHIEDPFGHHWTFHTRIEDVSLEEMRRRMGSMGGS